MVRKLIFILVLVSLTAGCGQSRTATPFSEPTPQAAVTTSPGSSATVETPTAAAGSQVRPDDPTTFFDQGNAFLEAGGLG